MFKGSEHIGFKIRNRRILEGLTQVDFAARLGSTQANLSRIENSFDGPKCRIIIKIAKALNCTIDELLMEN